MKFGPKAGSDRLPAHRLVTLSIATSEVAMTDSATLLRDHVTLQCRSLDRIFLQAYVPKLQSVGQGCTSCAGNGSSRFPPRQPLARSVRPRSRPSPSLRKGTNSRGAVREGTGQGGSRSPLPGRRPEKVK